NAALAATAALEATPTVAAADAIEALTSRLLEMEKGNLERQVALAHQEDALTPAAALLETETATLAALAEQVGAAGEESLADDEIDWEKEQREIVRLERQIGGL